VEVMLYEIQCCQCTNINLLLLHCVKIFVFRVETPQGQSVTGLCRIGPGSLRACHLGRRMAAHEMTLPETRGEFLTASYRKYDKEFRVESREYVLRHE